MSLRSHFRRLGRDERGTSMVELAAGIIVFLLLFFALMDFGRMTYNWVMAEKAVQRAARMAAVLPAACPNVPESNDAPSGGAARYGTSCSASANTCVSPPVRSCNGSTASPTASQIYARVKDLLPPGATVANLRYSYSFDPAMNFLGGPYVPLVTVELRDLRFEFVSPLAGLALAAGTMTQTRTDSRVPFPPMSVSLPGEDLNVGTNG